MQQFDFDGHQVSRVFKGNWQLAGGHGAVEHDQAIDDLFTYADNGINVFDMGDAYIGVEAMLGDFRQSYLNRFGQEATDTLRMHTKFIPDIDSLEDLSKSDVRTVIQRSLGRLGLDSLHLVQFHWWDYAKGDPIEAALHLEDLRREGLIEAVGLTNFDTEHTEAIIDAGVNVVSNQIQFSLIDGRPFNGMLQLAQDKGIDLFCYGTLAGGLLSGADYDPSNRSHVKYKLMVEEAGEEHYEAVITTLGQLAHKYSTSAANIAAGFALQTPGVSSVILGPKNAKHADELSQLSALKLEAADYAALLALAQKSNQDGTDIYSYERTPGSTHANIMHYNSNDMRSST